MAFTVQDDTGTVVGANAYITVAEFRDYWDDKNVDTSGLVDADVEGLIVESTQYIDARYTYNGVPLTGRDQTTEFPRECLYDKYGALVEGIPREVKTACAEYAWSGSTTDLSNTYDASQKSIKKEKSKVDVLEEEFEYTGSKLSSSSWNIYQIADNILMESGFVSNFVGVMRA